MSTTGRSDHAAGSAQAWLLSDDGLVPNNATLPLVIVHHAGLATTDAESDLIALFARHGWSAAWINGIYDFHHYHATSHEVLGIARGRTSVQFGGPKGPVVEARDGHIIVIPAGVGHCRLAASADLSVVGAYPGGCAWDLKRATPEARRLALAEIPRVPLPQQCPAGGRSGPLVQLWRLGLQG